MSEDEIKRIIKVLEDKVTTLQIEQARREANLENLKDELRRVAKSLLKQIDGVGGRIDKANDCVGKVKESVKLIDITVSKFDNRLELIDGEEGKLKQIHGRITKLIDKPWRILKKISIVVGTISGVLGLIWLSMLIMDKL